MMTINDRMMNTMDLILLLLLFVYVLLKYLVVDELFVVKGSCSNNSKIEQLFEVRAEVRFTQVRHISAVLCICSTSLLRCQIVIGIKSERFIHLK
jgi:hypothetical protein